MQLNGLPWDLSDKFKKCVSVINEKHPILIMGETGAGKTYIARKIHESSIWRHGKFIRIDVSAIETELFESELFGYEKGAFTGALSSGKKGLLDLAQSGTAFFDEIGNLDIRFQKKFLTFIEEKKYRRVGGITPVELKSGLIFATNKDLGAEVKRGLFREDLFYRISTCLLNIPPLRERIDHLEEIIKSVTRVLGINEIKFTDEAIRYLKTYNWPGNIRELRNYLILWSSEKIRVVDVNDLPLHIRNPENFDLKDAVIRCKKKFVIRVLKIYDWNINEAARKMGISRQHIYRLIKQLGIDFKELKEK